MASKNKDQRICTRTKVSLAVEYAVLTQEDYQQLKNKRSEKLPEGEEQTTNPWLDDKTTGNEYQNHIISALLKHIDSKLNYIINLLTTGGSYLRGQQLPGQGKAMDISAAGLKLLCPEKIDVGSLLSLKLHLPLILDIYINIIGEVRYAEQCYLEDGTTTYRVGVKFIEISEEEREILIRYTFQKQRELIRNKRGYPSS